MIIIQGIGNLRPVPVQNFRTYESIWTFGKIPWTGDRPDAKPLPTQYNTTQKTRIHIHAGFELAIPVYERSKTVHALDSAAIGTGFFKNLKNRI